MDYDDIDYDEGYSMRDIDNNWLMIIWIMKLILTLTVVLMIIIITIIITQIIGVHTRDKINKQTDRHNNNFLDRINKKLESLEAIERSTTVERKNDRDNRIDSFLDLYERSEEHTSELQSQ